MSLSKILLNPTKNPTHPDSKKTFGQNFPSFGQFSPTFVLDRSVLRNYTNNFVALITIKIYF